MSVPNGQPPQPMMGPQIAFQVTVDMSGNTQVTGPILENKVMAYGILEIAKDVVRDYHAQKASVVKPVGLNETLKFGRS